MTARLLAVAVLSALLAGCGTSAQQAAQDAATQAPAVLKDALVVAAVKAKVTAADVDTAATVRVSARDGRVRLAGRVRSASARQAAADAAKSVSGVTVVQNDLTVDPSAPNVRESASDLALAARVQTALAGQTGVNAFKVRVTAHGGTVTLAGSVPSGTVKTTMLDTARRTSGVRSLVDRVAVTP